MDCMATLALGLLHSEHSGSACHAFFVCTLPNVARSVLHISSNKSGVVNDGITLDTAASHINACLRSLSTLLWLVMIDLHCLACVTAASSTLANGA